ncbi:MAG: Sec-independent protein translocase protein TatB [Candidatus Kaistia colombiensis]|nr:MAG: Sec-independent protein translocase protein TatB [Kaistia sp.]
MLDIGWSEILVIAVVAIVVVGPKDLPPMLRALGRTVSKMRKMAGEFQGQFNEALKEAELDDVKKSFDELRGLNPLNDIKDSLNPLSGPIAKPSPAPVPPSADQPAQLLAAADVEPAKPLEVPAVVAEPVAAPKPKRAAKAAQPADGDAPAKPKARASRAKAKPADGGEAVSGEAKAPARARKPKPPVESAPPAEIPVASAPSAVEPVVVSVTEEPKT